MRDPSRVLFPLAAARSTRLSLLAILTVLVLAAGWPAPSTPHAAAGTTPRWAWPVELPHTIVWPFIAPPTPYGVGHRGIDIAATPDSVVLAPEDGVVFFVGVVVDRPVLSMTHAGGLVSSYEPLRSTLAVGSAVRRGDPIGTLIAGHCAATCLHLGARLHGRYVSPIAYLGTIRRAVLLPVRARSPARSGLVEE
jgi:murein DD-endopeptidase MepM/ murein hydrolase activator NlpD